MSDSESPAYRGFQWHNFALHHQDDGSKPKARETPPDWSHPSTFDPVRLSMSGSEFLDMSKSGLAMMRDKRSGCGMLSTKKVDGSDGFIRTSDHQGICCPGSFMP